NQCLRRPATGRSWNSLHLFISFTIQGHYARLTTCAGTHEGQNGAMPEGYRIRGFLVGEGAAAIDILKINPAIGRMTSGGYIVDEAGIRRSAGTNHAYGLTDA